VGKQGGGAQGRREKVEWLGKTQSWGQWNGQGMRGDIAVHGARGGSVGTAGGVGGD